MPFRCDKMDQNRSRASVKRTRDISGILEMLETLLEILEVLEMLAHLKMSSLSVYCIVCSSTPATGRPCTASSLISDFWFPITSHSTCHFPIVINWRDTSWQQHWHLLSPHNFIEPCTVNLINWTNLFSFVTKIRMLISSHYYKDWYLNHLLFLDKIHRVSPELICLPGEILLAREYKAAPLCSHQWASLCIIFTREHFFREP